ncbi:efflux RND transporter periplasmic adaptor subunit [Sphingomonas ginkgonis]|uniref:Efflux RND transporter periplasmic adaptor subunit n=1 Tax=Sphingomonas ginkgonis TaxID=2315330 RepID=A0A429V7G4_9SPHN|nr:efflux RND transporter periplasmic adaptor subunit [Sphingomonas ginkgonis]RST29864.1 efflux RND transporter periplasmic adaptor subunit [Sphingomonas ginkgonis]
MLSRTLTIFLLAGVAAGCSGASKESSSRQRGPTQVGFVVVSPTSVPLLTQLDGRTSAFQTSEVRPQVNGIVRKRLFTEGGYVRAGQPLYQIDPSIYEAAADQASANLSAAQATASAAQTRAARYRPLAQMQAISQQDYTDAAAQARQAQAQVSQNAAALRTARINLRYTSIPAPISGHIGRSLFTVGALVTASQASPLAVIQNTDPIYVDIQQSSADMLTLRRELMVGGVSPGSTQVRLKLDDGSDYGYTGTVQFNEVTVDQTTGTVTLRARFPNPKGLLMPGMFASAIFTQAIDNNVFLVPQQAIVRDLGGKAAVFVVGPGGKAVRRVVDATRTYQSYWVVKGGLNKGDKVITQGTNGLKNGMAVRAVPASTPERLIPRAPGAGGKGGRGGGAGGGGGAGQGGGGGSAG